MTHELLEKLKIAGFPIVEIPKELRVNSSNWPANTTGFSFLY
jgi:hypothetical protein